MRIAMGSDHGGFNLKAEIFSHLIKNGYEVTDFGTYDSNSVDYPDYAIKVAEAIKSGECDTGILVCGTGLGISIAANKIPGIRAALCTDSYTAKMSREHNDANILALGGRVVGVGLAEDIVDVWLKTKFLGGRHGIRVNKISEIEKKYKK